MAKSTVRLLDLPIELLLEIIDHVREDDQQSCNPLGNTLGMFGITAQTHPNLRNLALTCRLLSLHARTAYISHSLGLRGGRDPVSYEERLQDIAGDDSLRTKIRHMAFCIDALRLMAAGLEQSQTSLDACSEKWRSAISKFTNLRSVSLDMTMQPFVMLAYDPNTALLRQALAINDFIRQSVYAALTGQTALTSLAWLQLAGAPPLLRNPQLSSLANRLKSLSIGIVYQSNDRSIYYYWPSTGIYTTIAPVVDLEPCIRYCQKLVELKVYGLKDFNGRQTRPRMKLGPCSPLAFLKKIDLQYLCIDGLADLLASKKTQGTISTVHLYKVRFNAENTWLPTLQTLLECENLQSTALGFLGHQPDVESQIGSGTTNERRRYWQEIHAPCLFFEELVALGKILAMMRRRRGDLTSDFACSSAIKPFNDLAIGNPVQQLAPGTRLRIIPFNEKFVEYLANPAQKWSFPRDLSELQRLFVPHRGIHPGCLFEVYGLGADDDRAHDFLLKLSFAAHYSKSTKQLRAPSIYRKGQRKQTFGEFSALVLEAVRDFQPATNDTLDLKSNNQGSA